ncbi:MAG: hypothetical protein N3E52_00875 [Candidatus Bathyarchaeota archaeon]|nr:hypothetical protein [Candidatus Bathyarchaeota archaeon]
MQANFKPLIVWLILNGKAEEALEHLANACGISTPKLKVACQRVQKENFSLLYG